MSNIQCACCKLSAIKIIGNALQVTIRHNGAFHTTVVSMAEVEERIAQDAMLLLLDSRKEVIVT